jgi:hypothetical protein
MLFCAVPLQGEPFFGEVCFGLMRSIVREKQGSLKDFPTFHAHCNLMAQGLCLMGFPSPLLFPVPNIEYVSIHR